MLPQRFLRNLRKIVLAPKSSARSFVQSVPRRWHKSSRSKLPLSARLQLRCPQKDSFLMVSPLPGRALRFPNLFLTAVIPFSSGGCGCVTLWRYGWSTALLNFLRAARSLANRSANQFCPRKAVSADTRCIKSCPLAPIVRKASCGPKGVRCVRSSRTPQMCRMDKCSASAVSRKTMRRDDQPTIGRHSISKIA